MELVEVVEDHKEIMVDQLLDLQEVWQVVAEALADSGVVDISEDGKRVRRSTPLANVDPAAALPRPAAAPPRPSRR